MFEIVLAVGLSILFILIFALTLVVGYIMWELLKDIKKNGF